MSIDSSSESPAKADTTPNWSGGYRLGKGQRVRDILATEAKLFESEGIDPSLPLFVEQPAGRHGG
jgi:hypothetical protein